MSKRRRARVRSSNVQPQRLRIDSLEDRLAPATFTGVGPNLTIDLNTANEVATFSTDGTTVTVQLTNGTANTAATGGNVTGNGTATATFQQTVYPGTITITDSAAGTSVAFANSTGPYAEGFGITLNDPASGNVTFAGVSSFSATFNASTTAGFIASAFSSSVTLAGSSNLALTATGHDVLFAGAVNVAGTTSIAAAVVQLDNPANDFVGSLQLTGPEAASVFDVNALDLAASNFAFGSLNQTARITAGGNITQSGAITGTGNGILALTSTGGSINLPNTANSLPNTISLAFTASGANNVTFYNANTSQFGNVSLGTGTLSFTSTGNVRQAPGTTIQTGGALALAIDVNNNRNIVLNNAGNRIAGAVTVAEVGTGDLQDFTLHNAFDNASLPTGTPFAAAGDVRNLTLTFDNNGMALPGYNIAGNLSVTAGGDITQSAPLAIGGNTTATILGDFGINFFNPANAFAPAVSLNATQSTQAVLVENATTLTLGNCDLGRGLFQAQTVTGDITSTAAITQRKGAPSATFILTAGTTVTLTGANDFPATVNFGGVNLSLLSVRNVDYQANLANLIIPITVTDRTITFDNAAVVLTGLTSTNLTVTALGITQVGPLILSGTGTFSAGTYPINLSNAGNDFGSVNLNNSGRNAVTITDVNGLNFSGASNIGTGPLTITAGGNIGAVGAGRIIQANTGPVGDVNLTSTTGSITLTNNNAFRGVVSASVAGANTISLNNNNVAMVLGTVSAPGGAFSANAGTQGISQDPNSVLNFGSTSSFTGGTTITLTNRTNTFGGAVSLTGTNASVRATGPVVLAASNLTGTLSVKTGGTATDSITQTGAIIGASAATFDSGADSVTLTNPGNDFGSVSVTSTGASVSITDTNALNVGNIVVGGGTLTLTTGGTLGLAGAPSGIVQTTGNGAITLTTPAGAAINLGSTTSSFRGTVAITNSTNVTLQTLGDLSFTSTSIIAGNFFAVAGGTLNLPTVINVGTLNLSATTTNVANDITASGQVSFTGTANFSNNRIVNAAAGVVFNGDVNAGGTLTFNLGNNQLLDFRDGTWNQGANALTISGTNVNFNIGNAANNPARFIMSGGTISMPGNGNLTVSVVDGTFQVGTDALNPETVTVANGAGSLSISGSLAVGFGAVNDQLVKTGGGVITLGASSTLLGSGLAGTMATPVLVSQTELLTGRFANSVNAQDNPHDFFAGSDIVTPAYSFINVTIKAGGVAAPSGTATGFLPDGDKYTVISSLGAAAGLVTVVDPTGALEAVVRNTTAAGPSTLTISTTGGGDGQIPVGGVSIHSPGPVSVSASTSNFLGQFNTAGTLSSFTARDIGNGGLLGFNLSDGGSVSATSSITARVVNNSVFNLAGVLKSFKAVSVTGGSTITARSFGSLTTTGLKAAGNLGDFSPFLISTTPSNGTVVGSATIAGTLGGAWELRGNVGTVKAFKTNGWTFGVPLGANLFNGNFLSGAASLTLGPVTNTFFNATGAISTMTTSDITNSNLTAGSWGKVTVAANSSLALAGSIGASTLTATGNAGGIALAKLSIAGNLGSSTLNFLNGNATSISVGRIVNGSVITAVDTGTLGNIGSFTAGNWQSTNIDARTIGTLKITGSLLYGLFGNFTGSIVTVRNNTAGVAIGTFSAQGSVAGSTFDVQSGNLTNFLVGRQLGSSTIRLTNPVFGALGVIQAGDWTSGDTVLAKTIGTVASIGAAELFPASPLLLGGINTDTITAYLNTGTVAAIGKLTTKGDFANSSVASERGIGTVTVGRAVTGSFIIADDAQLNAANVGRINTLTAGALINSTAAVNTFGTVKIIGYAQPENAPFSIVFGDITSGNIQANGAAGTTPASAVGISSFSVSRFVQTNSVLKAPFGIKSLTITGGLLSGSQVVTDNPTTPTAGILGTFTVGEIQNSIIRTGSIGTLKTTGFGPSNLIGNISSSFISADSTATTPTGAQAIQTLTVAGDFITNSQLDAPASVGSVSIGGVFGGNSTTTRLQAGYAPGSKLGSISAGAWGSPLNILTGDMTTQSVGTFALKGNAARGIAGTVDKAFIDILGASAGIGLGTFTATGAISNSLIRVSDGDVTSFTALRLVSTDLLVGFRPVKGSDISLPPVASNWLGNHKIGSFKTTAPFSASDVTDSASFVDSNVIAAKLGSVSITGINPATTNSTKFGLAFRTTGGSAGTLTIAGVSHVPGFVSGQFDFVGLPG